MLYKHIHWVNLFEYTQIDIGLQFQCLGRK